MKKIDLSKVSIEMLDGSIVEHDVARELAQVIFQNTQSVEEHAFCVDLYRNPAIELTDRNRAIIDKYVDQFFKAFVKVAVNKLLND